MEGKSTSRLQSTALKQRFKYLDWQLRIGQGQHSINLSINPLTLINFFLLVNLIRVGVCDSAYPIREGGRILEFIYSSRQLMSKGGLEVGTATTHYYNS